MTRVLTAHTSEIDDVELAVAEILAEILPESNLLPNSIGLLTCYSEFVESGVAKALSDALPFDVAGCTSNGMSVDGELGQMILTLTVITSDELTFATVLSSSLYDEQEEPICRAYAAAANALKAHPAMIITYAPLINHVGGDIIVSALNRASDNTPLFGTLALDHTLDYHTAVTLLNGQDSRDGMVLVLVGGNIKPRFRVASISEDKIQKQRAIITSSEGNLLKTVNNISVLDYLNSLNLLTEYGIEGANVIPFIIDYNDGTHNVARAIFALTDEGFAVCGGAMPQGATLAIGAIDYEDVLQTTSSTLRDIVQNEPPENGMLIFSCLARNLVLGADTLAEMQRVEEITAGEVRYQFAYSGGEICPVYFPDGRLINRFHNDTLVVCIF